MKNKKFDPIESKSFAKVSEFVKVLIKSNTFLSDIQELRKRFHIPSQGFPIAKSDNNPYYQWHNNGGHLHSGQLDYKVKKLCEKYKLHFLYWENVFKYFLLFNRLELFMPRHPPGGSASHLIF